MARKANYDEEVAEWLARMRAAAEDMEDFEAFKVFIERRFEADARGFASQGQLQALWGGVEKELVFREAGIKSFDNRSRIGPALRYGIQGLRGAFSLRSARRIFSERTGRRAPY